MKRHIYIRRWTASRFKNAHDEHPRAVATSHTIREFLGLTEGKTYRLTITDRSNGSFILARQGSGLFWLLQYNVSGLGYAGIALCSAGLRRLFGRTPKTGRYDIALEVV